MDVKLVEWGNGEGFDLRVDGVCRATACYYWTMRPRVDGGGFIRQVYITDVESYERGCGTLLMKSIIDFFRNKAIGWGGRGGYMLEYIWLSVSVGNLRAIGLYRKCGFGVWGDVMVGDDVGGDYYMMCYKL